MNLLILTALPSELDGARAPKDARVIYTGVGKVKTAVATAEAIASSRPDLIVNYGTAGKINTSLNGLVTVAKVLQRDMTAVPLVPRGVTPLSSDPPVLQSGVAGVTCGTGDNFVTSADPWLMEKGVDIVDMELFAMAFVCERHGLPWRSFKFITDDANDFAADHWTANVMNGEALFWAALDELLGSA
jgi:adenosylhomocysteine nucleosidase